MQLPPPSGPLTPPPDRPPRRVSDAAWAGYLRNLGVWVGKRALSNSRGRVLVDLPARTSATQFRTPAGEPFVLWRTSVRTADGPDGAEEEWSRPELADFAALAADGCFSVGAPAFSGEPITIDQCVADAGLRVRTTHAFDWDGGLSGLVATRERYVADEVSERIPEESLQLTFVEPVAWRSPRVLLDYLQGSWEGRGLCVDAISGLSYNLSSRFRMSMAEEARVDLSSVLTIGDGGPVRVFESHGKVDANFLFFPESNLQCFLLPGGVFVSSPIRIRRGRPFTVETGFLVRPDSRKRVQRVYNKDSEWVNTIFINERRVG